MIFVGIGISWHWRVGWFSAGPDDDFDICLMIGPVQFLFDEEQGCQ